MSVGRLHTFDEFNWTSGLSASAQRIAVQAALDSGERLLMPVGETVQIDGTLYMNYRTELTGAGGDLTNQALAASQFRTSTPNIPMLRVQADHCRISGINFHTDALGCDGIVLGDGVSKWARGAVIDRVTTNSSMNHGVNFLSAGGCVLRDSWFWGMDSAVLMQNTISPDTGDNKITNCDLNANSGYGAGLRWTSGGGLYVTGCKFGSGLNHINMNWNTGGSGNFALIGCSLESCSGISVDMQGAFHFIRMQICGNGWGVSSACFVVRNFSPLAWLQNLVITGNDFTNGGQAPLVDLGCTENALVSGNVFMGNGAPQGIITRSGSTGAIGPNRFIGCSVPVQNDAGWAMTAQL